MYDEIRKKRCARERVCVDVWLVERIREGIGREDTINTIEKDVVQHAHTRTREINIKSESNMRFSFGFL